MVVFFSLTEVLAKNLSSDRNVILRLHSVLSRLHDLPWPLSLRFVAGRASHLDVGLAATLKASHLKPTNLSCN